MGASRKHERAAENTDFKNQTFQRSRATRDASLLLCGIYFRSAAWCVGGEEAA